MAENAQMMKWAGASDLFRLTAAMFRYPTPDFAEALLDGSFAGDCRAATVALGLPTDVLDALEGALPPSPDTLDAAEVLRELRREHTRLFGIPKKEILYLYESRYMQDEDGSADDYLMFINPCCLDVEKEMRSAGFEAKRTGEEPLDHISTELEFVGLLYGKAASALAAGDDEEANRRLGQASHFRETHLDRWADPFFTEVERETQGALYRALAATAKNVVDLPL